jgi:hypothetical protein
MPKDMSAPTRPSPAWSLSADALRETIRTAGAEGVTRSALRSGFPKVGPTTLRKVLRHLTETESIVERLELRPDRQGVIRAQLTYFPGPGAVEEQGSATAPETH